MADAVDAAVTKVAREDGGRVLAILARRFDDLDVADDAVQEALIEAATTWPSRGIPDNPGGWIHRVANRKAIDILRRRAVVDRRAAAAMATMTRGDVDEDRLSEQPLVEDDGENPIGADERLRLVLLCCHPALDEDAQIALTLRLVGGLTTPQIASSFLLPEATLAQRVVRAKRKIRDAGIPLAIPDSIEPRLGAVLRVLYLVANEGYLARGDGERVARVDLVDEAIRLTEVVSALAPDQAEVEGLLALQLFHRARLSERTDARGDLVLLEDQDRTGWDLDEIRRANELLGRAIARRHPGVFQVQALIASHHANARTAADTDWPAIVGLYRQLVAMDPSPVVALNLAVAVSMADGPRAGLAELESVSGLEHYHLFHAARGEMLLRAGSAGDATTSFERALELATNPAERRHLAGRLTVARGREDGTDGTGRRHLPTA